MRNAPLTVSLASFTFATAGFLLSACTWPSGSWSDGSSDDPQEFIFDEPIDDPVIDEEQPAACPASGGIGYERPAPNVMLLVDRSGFMAEPDACDSATCPSKWQSLLALGDYLSDVQQHARLGMSVFPAAGNNECSTTAGLMVPISTATDTDELILDAVGGLTPGGRTPIASALDEVSTIEALADPARDNIVVLLTDGMPNCACESDTTCERTAVVEAVQRLVDRPVPIKLYVVGFGAGAAEASDTLSLMADTAGTGLPGLQSYYQATRIEELIGRLYQVAADVAPCRFNLDERPESDSLQVHLDDALVAKCTSSTCTSGYTYDADAGVVELHGASCEAIRDGQCHDVWFDVDATE